ncbi:hypothetical protein BLSTO_00912 [Blastocystis sp. subtype 1]
MEGKGDWSKSFYRFEKLDSNHPILYINDKKLVGHYEATDGTHLLITPEDTVEMSNKKLVFRPCPERPNYELVSRASAMIREGNLNVAELVDSSSVCV